MRSRARAANSEGADCCSACPARPGTKKMACAKKAAREASYTLRPYERPGVQPLEGEFCSTNISGIEPLESILQMNLFNWYKGGSAS